MRMDRSQPSEGAAVVAIECVAGSSRAEEWGEGGMPQTGDVVEEIEIRGSAAARAPFKGGRGGVQKLLHAAFKRGDTSIKVRVRRGAGPEFAELQACIVPHEPAGRRQYVLRSIHDPNYAVGFVDRSESECIALQEWHTQYSSAVVCRQRRRNRFPLNLHPWVHPTTETWVPRDGRLIAVFSCENELWVPAWSFLKWTSSSEYKIMYGPS